MTGRPAATLSPRGWSAFGRPGSLDEAMSHYDRESDIAALNLKGFDGGRVFGEDHDWGLLLRDRVTQEVVGVEFWRASERLPVQLLDALPEPAARDRVVIERQPA